MCNAIIDKKNETTYFVKVILTDDRALAIYNLSESKVLNTSEMNNH